MQISDINVQTNAAEWVKKVPLKDSSIQTENEPKAGKAYDKVSISANAGNSAEALVKSRANALPEIREDKIAVAKERMENGYYNTQEFNKELVNRLVEG